MSICSSLAVVISPTQNHFLELTYDLIVQVHHKSIRLIGSYKVLCSHLKSCASIIINFPVILMDGCVHNEGDHASNWLIVSSDHSRHVDWSEAIILRALDRLACRYIKDCASATELEREEIVRKVVEHGQTHSILHVGASRTSHAGLRVVLLHVDVAIRPLVLGARLALEGEVFVVIDHHVASLTEAARGVIVNLLNINEVEV